MTPPEFALILVRELVERSERSRLGRPALSRRCDRGNLGDAGRLGNQLVDRNIPGDTADRHDGRLLACVDLHDAAGPVVAQAGDDHPVASLKARPGIDKLLFPSRLALKLGKAQGKRLA